MNVPVVPLSAFSNLAGPALAEDLRRLVANPVHAALVLFSDTLGEQLAILPVGPGQGHERLEEVDGAEIEGLRPLCALRLRGAARGEDRDEEREKELARLEESLKTRERQVAEREATIEQREQLLVEREREFFRRSGETTRQAAKA
jgi:flagellar motility protein MotE (MotC chaperone)